MSWAALASAAPAATPPDARRAELSKLRTEIDQLRRRLDQARGRRDNLGVELRQVETAVGERARTLASLATQLREQRILLESLRTEHRAQQRTLDGHRAKLVGQMRAAYAMGRQDYLKMLLNQQDPAAVGRTLVYYDYLNRARVERIAAIERQVRLLDRLSAELHRETTRLEGLQASELEAKTALESEQARRARVLERLASKIKTDEQRLASYLEDVAQLELLLKGLEQALADIPAESGQRKPFKTLKGRLPLPINGSVLAAYGSPRRLGNSRWQGVLIGAREGAEVRSISHGRVAFADWLRGFGLLVIVDHGDGYMSLYGQNQGLFVETGDWLEAGQVIAAAGRSGGQDQSGLYFEIRHNGRPTNPLGWCRLARNR